MEKQEFKIMKDGEYIGCIYAERCKRIRLHMFRLSNGSGLNYELVSYIHSPYTVITEDELNDELGVNL